MAESPVRRLIDASSLGTPTARALRGSVPDDVAARIVERSKEIGAAIDRATPCLAPDVDHYSKQSQQLNGKPVHTIRGPQWVLDGCDLWYCPTSGDVKCGQHRGFDVCCDRYDQHQPVRTMPSDGAPDSLWLEFPGPL
ncbi:hypothetical protein ABZY58_11135 [Micromonospora tulbaghiae]|uniref:hypothetical protein n=1 Tax=Micromonospora tulbaghiae TaxID=479978 RepID=UPI0033ACE6B7